MEISLNNNKLYYTLEYMPHLPAYKVVSINSNMLIDIFHPVSLKFL